MNALLRMLLVLAHFLHSLYIVIRYACDVTYRCFTKPWHASTTAELDALVRTLTKINKIPRHLVIVLGLCDESVLDCVRIIGWCITLDIPYISFFDRNGKNTIWYWYITVSVCAEQIRKNFKNTKKKDHFMCTFMCACTRMCTSRWRFQCHLSCKFIVRLSYMRVLTNCEMLSYFNVFVVKCNILEQLYSMLWNNSLMLQILNWIVLFHTCLCIVISAVRYWY